MHQLHTGGAGRWGCRCCRFRCRRGFCDSIICGLDVGGMWNSDVSVGFWVLSVGWCVCTPHQAVRSIPHITQGSEAPGNAQAACLCPSLPLSPPLPPHPRAPLSSSSPPHLQGRGKPLVLPHQHAHPAAPRQRLLRDFVVGEVLHTGGRVLEGGGQVDEDLQPIARRACAGGCARPGWCGAWLRWCEMVRDVTWVTDGELQGVGKCEGKRVQTVV